MIEKTPAAGEASQGEAQNRQRGRFIIVYSGLTFQDFLRVEVLFLDISEVIYGSDLQFVGGVIITDDNTVGMEL